MLQYEQVLRTEPATLDGNSDELILKAIAESLEEIFGADTAKSINFYIDSNIALTDLEVYVRGLRSMFMEGADVILGRIGEKIARNNDIVMKAFFLEQLTKICHQTEGP